MLSLPAVPLAPLHGASPAPVPHWAVLLAAVPALWLLAGGGVALLDRILSRVG